MLNKTPCPALPAGRAQWVWRMGWGQWKSTQTGNYLWRCGLVKGRTRGSEALGPAGCFGWGRAWAVEHKLTLVLLPFLPAEPTLQLEGQGPGGWGLQGHT